MIFAGIGMRSGCPPYDLVLAMSCALASVGRELGEVQAIFAPDLKRHESSLPLAAQALGKPLVFLPIAELSAQSGRTLTRSARVLATFSLPSVAETAALAGASTQLSERGQLRLLGPRSVFGGATCALASCEKTV